MNGGSKRSFGPQELNIPYRYSPVLAHKNGSAAPPSEDVIDDPGRMLHTLDRDEPNVLTSERMRAEHLMCVLCHDESFCFSNS